MKYAHGLWPSGGALLLQGAALLLALLQCPLRAATDVHGIAASQDTLRLSWEQFRRTVDSHPRMEGARASIRLAAGKLRESGALPNPEWELSSRDVEDQASAGSILERELTVSLPLDWIWTRPALRRAAKSDQALAAAHRDVVDREVLVEAGEAFWTLVRDQSLADDLAELDRQMQSLQLAVDTRVRVGEARPLEAVRIQVETLQVRLEAAAAQRSLDLAQDIVGRWLPPGHGVPVADGDLLQLPEQDSIDCDAGLPDEYPRLVAAEARVDMGRSELGVERLGVLPRIGLLGSLEETDDQRSRGVGLALEIPLFNWNRGPVEQARASLQMAQSDLAAERREMMNEFAAAVSAYRTSRNEAVVYKEQILPKAEEAAAILEQAWQLGEADLFELIDARRTLGDTRRTGIEVFHQAQLSWLRLQAMLDKEMN